MSDEYDLASGPDPAAFAAAAPEPAVDGGDAAADAGGGGVEDVADAPDAAGSAAGEPVPAVGIGPGDPSYLTPRGEAALRDADVVVGFESVLSYVEGCVEGDALACGYRSEAETLERFAERVAAGERGAAALMGDPNHSGYQFLGKVERAVDRVAERSVRVIPGVSSLQVAASRARTPMEAATFVTLHRSGPIDDGLERLRRDVGDRHLLVLPRPYDWMPRRIASTLVADGADPSLPALVFEHLTHESESATRTTLGELAEAGAGGDDAAADEDATRFSDLSVLVVRAE